MQTQTMRQCLGSSHKLNRSTTQPTPRCAPQRPRNAAAVASQTTPAAAHQCLCQASRRDLLGSSVLATFLLAGSPAHAGLDRYVKKRKLDPLDTYVPLVLEARDVLAELDGVMVKDPSTARQLLRSGPFSGMRDNIRALGQYAALPAAEGGAGVSEADAAGLVQSFFRALEDYDLLLYNAVREYKQQQQKADKASSSGEGGDEDAGAAGSGVDPAVGLDAAAAVVKLQAAVQQLDRLIATVPPDVLSKSQQVLAKVKGKQVAVPAQAS